MKFAKDLEKCGEKQFKLQLVNSFRLDAYSSILKRPSSLSRPFVRAEFFSLWISKDGRDQEVAQQFHVIKLMDYHQWEPQDSHPKRER
uniref:Uncharacterized protein n=1 Tax=Cucumis sativus TaxID=3659 RepID=A0A0A0LDL6_CUCSA